MTTGATTAKTPVPWVTLALILANLVAAVLTTLAPDVAFDLAFRPREPQFVPALVSMFLHANTIHLLGNMVFLAAVGPQVESVAGRLPYLAVYLAGGLIGVAAHWAVMSSMGGDSPLLGASGAIAACVGYCAIRFMSRKVPLAPKLSVTVGGVALIWLLLQAVGFFVRFGTSIGGAAYWTHLAGFLTGLLLSLLLRAPEHARVQHGHDIMDKMGDRSPAALLRAAEQHLRRHPDDPRALRELADAQHLMGDHEHESETLVRLLQVSKIGDQPVVVQNLASIKKLDVLDAVERVKLATQFTRNFPEAARFLLRSVVDDSRPNDQKADALVALLQLVDGEERERLASELTSNYALHPATTLARAKGLLS